MNTLTHLHLEHLEYALKRFSNVLTSALLREKPSYDMQPLFHCLDRLDKGVRTTALFMTAEWPQQKTVEAQVTQETLGSQSGAESLDMDVLRSETELKKEGAKEFFSSLPWGSEAAERPDERSVSPRVHPGESPITGSATPMPSQANAAGYFSSLPWQHEGRTPGTRSGNHLVASESTPDVPRFEAEFEKGPAKEFFSKLPWRGEGAERPDDGSASLNVNPEKPSITRSATTTHSQGTAAGYFSSLPWQKEEPSSCTGERAHLHIQAGSSAPPGKVRVMPPDSNPILAATHSAIQAVHSASSDDSADNLPQEAKHRLAQTVENPTITRRQNNEHPSSDDEPAKTPQTKDNL